MSAPAGCGSATSPRTNACLWGLDFSSISNRQSSFSDDGVFEKAIALGEQGRHSTALETRTLGGNMNSEKPICGQQAGTTCAMRRGTTRGIRSSGWFLLAIALLLIASLARSLCAIRYRQLGRRHPGLNRRSHTRSERSLRSTTPRAWSIRACRAARASMRFPTCTPERTRSPPSITGFCDRRRRQCSCFGRRSPAHRPDPQGRPDGHHRRSQRRLAASRYRGQ